MPRPPTIRLYDENSVSHTLDKYTKTGVKQPAVILLDLKMPRVDGLEALRQIREITELRTIPIVILTSSAEESDLVRGYELGANGYVLKPVQCDSFMEAMSKVGVYWLMVNHPMK